MRTAQPKTKVRTEVAIPDHLRSFLADVNKLIAAGDEATTTESDDLLQCQSCYGGLSDPAQGTFSFTFFPGEGTRRKWLFDLRASDIAAIAANTMTSLLLWACPNPDCGSMFASPDDLCIDCDYVDDTPAHSIPQGSHATRREWALAYYSLNPTAHPLMMIGDFNGAPGLGKALGNFSLAEAAALKSEAVPDAD